MSSINYDEYDMESRTNTDLVSIAKHIKDYEIKTRETTKCRKCNGSITITKVEYENKKIYLEITCPCSVVENYDIKSFKDNYIINEEINKNPRKIITSDLFCACDNKSINEYYCQDSQKNLCNNCIGKERDHINHTIIDFKDERIKRIIDNIKDIKFEENDTTEENNSSQDEDNSNSENRRKNNRVNELLEKRETLEEDDLDNFRCLIELLKSLVLQYEKNPYYNLYQTIKNLNDFALKMDEKTSTEKRKIITKKRIRFKREFKDLKEGDNLISINIIQNNFYDLNILKQCSKNFLNLKILRLQENNIDDIKVLSEIEFPNLKELNLSKNRLNDECIVHLKNLKSKDCITVLNVYDNNIKNPEFFTIIKDFTKLEVLYVGHNQFEDKFNAESYDFPDTLTKIGLTIGVFSDKSIKAIKKFKFKNLETLYLKGNGLKNLGFIKELQCPNLKNIWLRNNLIQDYKPLESLKSKIKLINLRGNLISNISDLDKFLEQFEVLDELVLSDNKIDLNNSKNSEVIDRIIKAKKKKKFILKYN